MRCLIDSNIIGIIIWSHDGRITDANETFLRMVGYSRADLVAGQVSWMELTPAEWRNADAQRLAMVKSMGISPPYEKEYFHKAGHRRMAAAGVGQKLAHGFPGDFTAGGENAVDD